MSVQPFPVQRDGLLLIGKGMSTFSHSAYNKLPRRFDVQIVFGD